MTEWQGIQCPRLWSLRSESCFSSWAFWERQWLPLHFKKLHFLTAETKVKGWTSWSRENLNQAPTLNFNIMERSAEQGELWSLGCFCARLSREQQDALDCRCHEELQKGITSRLCCRQLDQQILWKIYPRYPWDFQEALEVLSPLEENPSSGVNKGTSKAPDYLGCNKIQILL